MLEPATVLAAKDKVLVYELADGAKVPEKKLEGMPLVNSAGEVVAIHSGAAHAGGGSRGLANPAANVRRLLEEVFKKGTKGAKTAPSKKGN